MSWELNYEAYMCGIASEDIPRIIEENEEYKCKIETEIFALILSDPAKVRNQKRKSKKDKDNVFFDDDDSWMNNPQYLTKLWEELKEQWEECNWKLMRCKDAEESIKRKTRKVKICKDCMRELEWVKEKDESGYYHDVLKCPKCGKVFAGEFDDDETKPKPDEVEILTWSEG